MKKNILILLCLLCVGTLLAQNARIIELETPDVNRKGTLMQALLARKSVRETYPMPLKLQDLSDILWAANGVNRSDGGNRTAPSAVNGQDIDIYLFMNDAVYVYDALEHLLRLVIDENRRSLIRQREEENPAIFLLLVSDISRFKYGNKVEHLQWGAMDAGIVAQNVLLFCAANHLLCWPRSGMDNQKVKKELQLKESQYPLLSIPISYRDDK